MKRKFFIIGFISGILFVIVFLVGLFFIVKNQGEKSATEFATQQNITNAELEVFSINQKSLDSLYFYDLESKENFYISKDSGNFTFINYWGTWCIPCVAEMPEFASLIARDEIKKSGLNFIFASQEDEETIMKFEKSRNFGLPYFLDTAESRPAIINHSTVPTSYLIDKNKLLVYKFSGLRQWDSEMYRNLLLALQ